MKFLKTILTALCTLFILTSAKGQNKDSESVLLVMKAYKDALQNLTTEGTFELFSDNSQVFESGGVEGTYSHYIEHHLGPELGHFKSFTFSDYEIDVQVDELYAFTTETYVYTIVLKPDDKGNTRTIKKKGVATSILKKIDGEWKIIKTHSSSRNTK
jgi:ketosteroid isomerase-like protein